MSVAPNPTSGPAQTGGGATRTVAAAQPMSPGFFQLTPMAQQAQQRYMKMLVYGPPGVGKSTLAGSSTSVPAMKDVLLITPEGGDIVFEDNDRVYDPFNIDMLKLNKIEQLKKVFEWLQFHCRIRDRGDIEGLTKHQQIVGLPTDRVRKYRTVIIDSMTEVESLNMNAVLGMSNSDGMSFEVGGDFEAPGYTQFRSNNNTIQAVARSFRNLPIHLIIICGQRYSQDELKKFHYNPWMTGQLSTQIQSFVDLVGYLVVSTTDADRPDLRRMYIQPQAGVKFDAKCRRASIKKQFYDNPVMEDIMRDFGYPLTLPEQIQAAVAQQAA